MLMRITRYEQDLSQAIPYRKHEELIDAKRIFHVRKAISKCLTVAFLDIVPLKGQLTATGFTSQNTPE